MRYGFIGLGNMSSAILRGMVSASQPFGEFCGYNPTVAKAEKLRDECGLIVCGSNAEVVDTSDVVVVAVKPQMLEGALAGLENRMQGKLLVSVVAGRSVEYFETRFPGCTVARLAPNINAKIGASVTGVCFSKGISSAQRDVVFNIARSIGEAIETEERFMGIFGCIGGAAPAFTYLYLNALADAALKEGMPKKMALQIAAASAMGTAKMVLESGEHPCALSDQVCSPGGTTIEGIIKLRELGFESAVHKAVAATIEKGKRL